MYAKWIESDARFAFSNSNNGGVRITKDRHLELLAEESLGKIIAPDETGSPVLKDTPPTSREEIENLRCVAYADPISGSDRYFAEALRLEVMGDQSGAETARALGVARYQEIKEQYPW